VLECRRWYAAATTFKDTVAVDLKLPDGLLAEGDEPPGSANLRGSAHLGPLVVKIQAPAA
jgi:hypothetical protein